MGEGDGVYYSGSRTSARTDNRGSVARRLKKAAVAVVGLSALGGGAYFATTLLAGNPPGYVSGGPDALAPVAPQPSPSPSASPSPPRSEGPSPGPQPGTRNAVRQSARPSPTPSIPDDEVAADQVSRLLEASPQPAAPGMAIAGGPVTVSSETGTDGSSIRIVAARYDMTGRWSPLSPGDSGQAVGDARCTAKLAAVPGGPVSERPTMLMCWRMSPLKSVVTVAIRSHGRPLAGASVNVLDRNWTAMG
ncbi:MAG TPA: hypothetical protein VGD29_13835 [Actinoplanes sp.]|jgi:hypothetical protein